MTAHGRRCPGVGPTGHDPSPRTAGGLMDTPATHLPARPLPAHGHRDTSCNLQTSPGPMESNRYPTEAPSGPTGSLRSPTTSSGSHMPMPARIGTGPGRAPGHGIPHDALRTAHGRESTTTGPGIATIANIRPGPHTPGPALRCPAPRCTIWTSPLAGTAGMRNSIGSMPHRRRTGTAATPKPRLWPGNTPTAPAVGLPRAGFPRCRIPRPPTRRQPKSLLQIGSHGTNLTASLTGGRLQAGQVRAGAPGRPLNAPPPPPSLPCPASSSPSGAEGAESPGSPPPEAPWGSYNDYPGTQSWSTLNSHAHRQDPSATRARAHVPAEPGPAASGRPTRYWPSSPREHEGDRTKSLYSVKEERDDSFTAVLNLIKRSHNLEKPARVAPSRGKTALAQTLDLQAEPSPALHLPSSPPPWLRHSSTKSTLSSRNSFRNRRPRASSPSYEVPEAALSHLQPHLPGTPCGSPRPRFPNARQDE